MTLYEKIAGAERLIREILANYDAPVVMSSFGKDSMVMLEILKRMGLKLPIVFHREPFSPRKYEFANSVIAENDYVVYDYAPLGTAVSENNGTMEIINHYQVGNGYTYLPTGILPPEDGKPFLCGYRDLYLKPTGSFSFPWDVGFIAHKSSDTDPLLNSIPLKLDLRHNPDACDFAFPLRHFTDEDVWTYHREFNVPINTKRYNPENGFKEFADVTFNNDYHHACTNCIDRTKPDTVFCPKANLFIANISSYVRYVEPVLPEYVGEETSEAVT